MTTEYFDVAVVIPLEEELLKFLEIFPSREDRSTDTIFCHVVESGDPHFSMIVTQQQSMGKTSAMTSAGMILSRYDVGLLVCLGIAGSLSDDMKLGDVCYSGGVIDVLDNAKVVDDDDAANSDTELSPTHYATPNNFTAALNFIRTQPSLRNKYIEWQNERAIVASTLVPNPVPAPGGDLAAVGAPSTKSGAIVCGAVSKSALYNKKLRQIDRALLAIETESGGVFSQAQFHNLTPALTIRGISDYADKDKKKLEQASKGAVRQLAASNAASFLHLQIKNPSLQSALLRRREGRQLSLSNDDFIAVEDALGDALLQIGNNVDEALRKLSPEYKLQPKGYRLPLPRVRETTRADNTDEVNQSSPSEVRDTVEKHDRVILSIPRTYPDQSLIWVIADDLMRSEVSNKQAVPVVIDGEDIRGRRATFTDVVESDLAKLYADDGVQLIFLVENLPLASKHRLDTLIEQVEAYKKAKFIFVVRGDANLVIESEFAGRTAATPYELCPVSFHEIAHFVQKNFGMSGSESEVVALRLRDTFSRFDLDAHPTYFAGIPKEMLAALLQANRRSELIQLAVDGFLTFLVAGDKADISLSRSTRSRFLRKLIVEVHVEKRSFDQARLIAFTREFADNFDFSINPIEFIKSFIDQGILHFENGHGTEEKVQVSLPFIESYLLALELSSDPVRAKAYFDVEDVQFDLPTFDLYAEIGASGEIVGRIISRLAEATTEFPLKDSKDHVLLTDEISPSNIRKPQSAQALRKRLQNAVKAVRDGADKTDEKQKMLDLNDRIREASARQRRKLLGDDEDADVPDEAAKRLFDTSRYWAIGTVLLGSGAEHLDAATKRRLSAEIIKCATRMIDEWSRLHAQIDFEALKSELTSDEMLADLPGPADLNEKRKFVSGMVDLIEYSAMADPLRRTLGFLCEQARQRVLSISVENAEVAGLVDELVRRTWLADIEPSRGEDRLRAAIRALPQATFLRICLASHYLTRVYWNHWRVEDRLILLNAAEEAIKPVELTLDKSQLKRMVEKGAKAQKADDASN